MPTTTYRLCTIERTATITGGYDGKPLCNVHRVSGRYAYSPAHRPFLTSLNDAKEWIDRQYNVENIMGH